MEFDSTLDATVADAGVQFTFEVENTSEQPIELSFQSGKKADVAVYDSTDWEGLPRRALSSEGATPETRTGKPDDEDDPEEVWRWSDGRAFTQALESTTIAPGETETFSLTWDGPEPGEYQAVATLETDVDCLATTAFSV